MKKTIPIFYAIDDEYSKFVAVSIKSLIMNANKDYNYDINIIYENLSKEYLNSNIKTTRKMWHSKSSMKKMPVSTVYDI